MSNTTTLAIGMAVGGTVIAGVGAATIQALEHKAPTTKTVVRDFLIGAILVLFVMQLVPESSTSLLQSAAALLPMAAFAGGASTEGSSGEELEVQVGVPQF